MKHGFAKIIGILLVLVLLTSCIVGSTFAKYITQATGTETARVAKWGFVLAEEQNGTPATVTNTFNIDLFKTAYDGTVAAADGTAEVVAPGTSGAYQFSITGTPEVEYTINLVATETCDAGLEAELVFQLEKNGVALVTDGTISAVVDALNAEYDEDDDSLTSYDPNTAVADTYDITWEWAFDNGGDVADTTLGDEAVLDTVNITVSVTVTQID